ncbi:hypothetical protein GLOIN_2v1666429 [Rhizophagus irregularis DAOM 181602=DAOM 197198]|uniref:Uncharacterized protein n=2 Tax=Rhizophagus irregularis TaxID=588596 RepID=A0A2P4PJA9_RHIID|nr:hypothetical protein GLOIN_2v1666429 [Rhizophagus irregularis DAOM 181602=DAOM 197198]POG65437.1 hypothetical protein GLOIN_2v1666429 [Rhizophagus irregularis DAOM 181602=DAOM 197198]|eukprot:XP_025172303.1 hypothetical protein GLOIN_2v1666429 [Rhizophagus irregularis DAOM 181602=DAOM 197198]
MLIMMMMSTNSRTKKMTFHLQREKIIRKKSLILTIEEKVMKSPIVQKIKIVKVSLWVIYQMKKLKTQFQSLVVL